MSKGMVQQQGNATEPVGWKQWEGSNGLLSMAHAMRAEDAGKACCGSSPGMGVAIVAANDNAPKCSKCVKLLAVKANGGKAIKQKRPDPRTLYQPRFTFDDWEKGR